MQACDNATTRDFLALLPLTLTLDDYASTEKIAYLPQKLSIAGAPEGVDPSVGDITYYAPCGTLRSSTRILAIRTASSSSAGSMAAASC
jgi:hypothetical protein